MRPKPDPSAARRAASGTTGGRTLSIIPLRDAMLGVNADTMVRRPTPAVAAAISLSARGCHRFTLAGYVVVQMW
jgi:hypothetical protein